ncbi:hypothetical protein D3C78_884780 [compost metagenome]
MDRVQLLDHRQGRAFVLPHQCTLGHQRPANAPGDRRGDGGITQVQPGQRDSGLAGGNVGGGLQGIGPCVVVVLGADGLVRDQAGVALLLKSGLEGIGLGLAQCGLGTVQVGLERCRVDAKQHLALFHIAAFAEGALQNHTGDPGAHFGDTRSGNPPAQFAADRQRAG